MASLRFNAEMLSKIAPSGMDVQTTLAHFAIVTYMVDPDILRTHVHERFELDCITASDGSQMALISVVPFLDRDFRFVRMPWPKWSFGQTNYRAYVRDRVTGEHVVWFFGTSLASATVCIPRFVWKLPWYHAQIRFDTSYDNESHRYTKYRMVTQSKWAPAELDLTDTGEPVEHLPGFEELEAGLVTLTHPLTGYFYLRDGSLGSYSIWHDRLNLTRGEVVTARFPLLDTLGLVPTGDVSAIHSVMIQPETEFTIYLPPKAVM